MESNFWLARWEQGETGWHLEEINRHLASYWPQLRVPAGTRVMVPLCGKTLDLLWLAAQGFRVLGVELSRRAVEEFFADNRLNPEVTGSGSLYRYRVDEIEILCGDFFALDVATVGELGAVYDRAALIALPPDMRRRYAAHLDSLTAARTPRLLITLDYDQSQAAGPPFSVEPAEVRQLFAHTHRVTELAAFDALPETPGLRRRGVTALTERVFRLDPA